MLDRQASVNSTLPPPSPTRSQPPPSPSPSSYDEARKQRLSAMLDSLPPELERRLSVHHGIKLHKYDTVSGRRGRMDPERREVKLYVGGETGRGGDRKRVYRNRI